MKNTIKLFIVIAFIAIIGFAVTSCSTKGSGSSGGSSGSERRLDLQGDWEMGSGYYPNYFQSYVADGVYVIELTGGDGDHIYCELLSYDGNKAVLQYDPGTMNFTAKITGNTLVIDGLTDDKDNYEYFAKFNGSYTKIESQSYDDGER
jgi:hypothetical protein